MKKKIHFIANWGADKQKAWSGTRWGLYQALSKLYNIDNIDVPNHKVSFLERLLLKLKLIKKDMGLSEIFYIRKKYTPIIEQEESPIVFQFDECILTKKGICSYIYQDNTVAYIKYMAENLPNTYAMASIGNLTEFNVEKKLKVEKENQDICAGIFTMGKWLKKDCVERLHIPENRVHAVGGGINLDASKIDDTIKKGSNKILFVGRDYKRKGFDVVYKAFCELKKTKQDVELFVAGPQVNPIISPIDGYHYLGDCNHNTLSDYFNKCDIFVMPSYFEAYGLVFIEALTYGLPCIGRNCYEMPYFIQDGETGYLLESDDVKDLADKMKDLLTNDRIKATVIQKREWYINNYSWDAVAKRIQAVVG